MIDKEVFYKIADNNFKVFEIVSESNLQILLSLYPNKDGIREFINNKLILDTEKGLPQKVKCEIYLLLLEFIYNNRISLLEGCALFKVIGDILKLFGTNTTQDEVYKSFKEGILKFSMNRFYYQIGIFEKETIYKITDFFINIIYRHFYMFSYALTNKINIDLYTKKIQEYTLPNVQSLNEATLINSRNTKILKQYFVNKRPKTELEQKIETILEFQREVLEKKMMEEFGKQDEEFNKRLEELTKKKK